MIGLNNESSTPKTKKNEEWVSVDPHLQWSLQLSDSQVLQHSPLQLLHGIVVVVQQDASGTDVQAVWVPDEVNGAEEEERLMSVISRNKNKKDNINREWWKNRFVLCSFRGR